MLGRPSMLPNDNRMDLPKVIAFLAYNKYVNRLEQHMVYVCQSFCSVEKY